jgi:hypothetical protein
VRAGLRARGLCAGQLVPSRGGTPGWEHGTFEAGRPPGHPRAGVDQLSLLELLIE